MKILGTKSLIEGAATDNSPKFDMSFVIFVFIFNCTKETKSIGYYIYSELIVPLSL